MQRSAGLLFSLPVDPSQIPQLLERWNWIVVLGKPRARDDIRIGSRRQRERKLV